MFAETWRYREFILQATPTWRPYSSAFFARISGAGRVGDTLTCHAPAFRGPVDYVTYKFTDLYDETLQAGSSATYVVQERDRNSLIGCEALAVNAGGIGRAVTDFEERITIES